MAAKPPATIESELAGAAERFARAGCESPRLDAEILLAEALRVGRVHLIAYGEDALPPGVWKRFQDSVARREKREPLAYVVGRREFYGIEFGVTPAVLIPRPETEHLVEEALAFTAQLALRGVGQRGIAIADVGTGSGAIAVSLAVHLPRARICALDSSSDALAIAWRNASRHGVAERMCLLQSNLLENLPRPVDILVANLPYVSDAEWEELPPEIRQYEPEMALRGGSDGLDCIRHVLRQAPAHLRPSSAMLLEIGAGQAVAVRELALAAFPGAAVRIVQDYAGLDRVVVIEN